MYGSYIMKLFVHNTALKVVRGQDEELPIVNIKIISVFGVRSKYISFIVNVEFGY